MSINDYSNIVRIRGNSEFINNFFSYASQKIDLWHEDDRNGWILNELLSFNGDLKNNIYGPYDAFDAEITKINENKLKLYFATPLIPAENWLLWMSAMNLDVKFTMTYIGDMGSYGKLRCFGGQSVKEFHGAWDGTWEGMFSAGREPFEWVRPEKTEFPYQNLTDEEFMVLAGLKQEI